ncbi:MAG: signal peptide peptidase SppA [Bacteroidota bacterium]|nr:signal peptide peptidase SppA [Bacteroidota bacterium]
MKDFFKFMFASMLGTFLLMIIMGIMCTFFLLIIITIAIPKGVEVKPNSILRIQLDKPVMDRSPKIPLFIGMKNMERPLGLNEILKDIEKAKQDSRIKGIFLDIRNVSTGISTIKEIRDALADFKKTGKFIYAYSEIYTQSSYYLASVADKIYMNPEGMLEFKGLDAEMTYIKGLMDKLDIKVAVIRHGKFKAATEPLFLDKMSPENRTQVTAMIGHTWQTILEGISAGRNIPVSELNHMADSLSAQEPALALKRHLIDGMIYQDAVEDSLRKALHLQGNKEIPYISLEKYNCVPEKHMLKKIEQENKIAIIYALGDIVSGEGDDRTIGSDRISKAIRKAREDDHVKAIVLRVNSPGGSGLASDVIWREVDLAAKKKPVVASMGDVAASGGYYISCAATKIYADPTTITGSIGVFGVIPNMKDFFNKKLGITFDDARTNANSDFVSITKPLPDYQQKYLQAQIERFYDNFITKVADGRKLPKARVDSIGQGRVWNAVDAKKIGLVDEFGGLNDAIGAAAKLANLTSFRTISLPEQKDPWLELINQITGNTEYSILEKELGSDYKYFQIIRDVKDMKGIQARMPFGISVN